jgi:hypothetical protein
MLTVDDFSAFKSMLSAANTIQPIAVVQQRQEAIDSGLNAAAAEAPAGRMPANNLR